MNLAKLLQTAGVPAHLHQEAIASLQEAERRARGLLWHKIKVRFLYAGKIADMIPWEAERLIEVRPDLLSWDVEPIQHIRSYGDNSPHWHSTPEGDRATPRVWLNKDPESAEYKEAVAHCYWCPGEHPKSKKAVKAQYRRNGGAGEAYSRGAVIRVGVEGFKQWESGGIKVSCADGAWIISGKTKLLGFIPASIRFGFEVDNIFGKYPGTDYFRQFWFPIEGFELKAPATWSVRPFV